MTKAITFQVGNEIIKGTIFIPEEPLRRHLAILFIHGWTSSEKSYIVRAKPLVALGYVCLTFSMRGHGESDGELKDYSRQDHLRDCLAAYDILASEPLVDKTRIAVVGASYGGYLGSLLTAKRRVCCLALRAPALYPDERFTMPTAQLISEDLRIYRQSHLAIANNRALGAIHRFKDEILLIESGKDELIPEATIESYRQAISDKSRLVQKIIKGADHALGEKNWNREFIRILKEWFFKKMSI